MLESGKKEHTMIRSINPATQKLTFKSMDTKDKLVLSTPLLAAASSMHQTQSTKTSKILLNGANSFGKWTCGLLAAGTAISANKFLARNSKKVRDFEENHSVWSIIGAGVVATGFYHSFRTAARGVAHMNQDSVNTMTGWVKKIDDIQWVNGAKKSLANLKKSYRETVSGMPDFIQSLNRGLGKASRNIVKYLPELAIATACGLAMITPKMMPKD